MRCRILLLLGILSSMIINSTIPVMVVTLGIPHHGTSSYLDFPPIDIDDDDDLKNQAELYGWPGLGTEDNPIVISKLKISGTTSDYLMGFRAITSHLKIEDCILVNGTHGLALASASENIIVDHLQITNMTEEGIFICGTPAGPAQNIIVRNTLITNTDIGLHIQSSSHILLETNFISESNIGIEIGSSTDNITILQNIFDKNGAGVYLDWGKRHTILNNDFSNNYYNIDIDEDSRENNIRLNNFYNASTYHIEDDGTANTFSFNYYTNYSSYKIVDADDDGLNDNVFNIYGDAGSKDLCPLVAPATDIIELISTPRITSPLWSTPRTGVYTIKWQQSLNSLQKNITYDVYYSANSGDTWTTLVKDLTQSEYAWNTTLVANGETYKLKIIAKSSTKTCTFVSPQFAVYNEPTSDPNGSKTTGLELLTTLFILSLLSLSVGRKRRHS